MILLTLADVKQPRPAAARHEDGISKRPPRVSAAADAQHALCSPFDELAALNSRAQLAATLDDPGRREGA